MQEREKIEPFDIDTPMWKINKNMPGVVGNEALKEEINRQESERELAYALQKGIIFNELKSFRIAFYGAENNGTLSQMSLTLSTEKVDPKLDGKPQVNSSGECLFDFSREKLISFTTEDFINFSSDLITTAKWSVSNLKNLRLSIYIEKDKILTEINNEQYIYYQSGDEIKSTVDFEFKKLMRSYAEEYAKNRYDVLGERTEISERIGSVFKNGNVSFWSQDLVTEFNSFYLSALAKNLKIEDDKRKLLPVAISALGTLMEYEGTHKNLSVLVDNIWNVLESKEEKSMIANIFYQTNKFYPLNDVFPNTKSWEKILNEVTSNALYKVEVDKNSNGEIEYAVSENKEAVLARLVVFLDLNKRGKKFFNLPTQKFNSILLNSLDKDEMSVDDKTLIDSVNLAIKDAQSSILSFSDNLIGFNGLSQVVGVEKNGFMPILRVKLDEGFDKLRNPEEKADFLKDFLTGSIYLLREKLNLTTGVVKIDSASIVINREDVNIAFEMFNVQQEKSRLEGIISRVAKENTEDSSSSVGQRPIFKL